MASIYPLKIRRSKLVTPTLAKSTLLTRPRKPPCVQRSGRTRVAIRGGFWEQQMAPENATWSASSGGFTTGYPTLPRKFGVWVHVLNLFLFGGYFHLYGFYVRLVGKYTIHGPVMGIFR